MLDIFNVDNKFLVQEKTSSARQNSLVQCDKSLASAAFYVSLTSFQTELGHFRHLLKEVAKQFPSPKNLYFVVQRLNVG